MNLSDTGRVRLEGDLRRSPDLLQMPIKLDVAWDKGQLGQLSTLVMGKDRGWRGGLSSSVELSGTVTNLHIVASAGSGFPAL